MQAENPVPETPATGRRENLMAGGLLLLCLLSALGTWLYGVKPKDNPSQDKPGLSTKMFETQPEIGIIDVEGTIMHKAGSGFGGAQGASADHLVRSEELV